MFLIWPGITVSCCSSCVVIVQILLFPFGRPVVMRLGIDVYIHIYIIHMIYIYIFYFWIQAHTRTLAQRFSKGWEETHDQSPENKDVTWKLYPWNRKSVKKPAFLDSMVVFRVQWLRWPRHIYLYIHMYNRMNYASVGLAPCAVLPASIKVVWEVATMRSLYGSKKHTTRSQEHESIEDTSQTSMRGQVDGRNSAHHFV